MAKITLHSQNNPSTTCVSNTFIDEYMSDANGEFVKIYLYLLRLVNGPDTDFSISSIADKFEHTEKDIRRALSYWERMHLLRLEYDEKDDLSGVWLLDSVSRTPDAKAVAGTPPSRAPGWEGGTAPVLQTSVLFSTPPQPGLQENAQEPRPSSVPAAPPSAEAKVAQAFGPSAGADRPAKREYTPDDIRLFRQKESIAELLFIAERYLGRTLSATDVNTLLYLYDGLRFSTDLIEYLVESCVSNGHTSIRYIEKTALGWADEKISTVEEAKLHTSLHNQSCFTVMKAFGISGRKLVPSETELIRKWTVTYGFSNDLIAEACQRTMQAVHQPSFQYTDSILTGWHKKQVRTLSDVAKLDAAFQEKKKSAPAAPAPQAAAARNKFNNFRQRTYDYDQLEEMLLTTNVQ